MDILIFQRWDQVSKRDKVWDVISTKSSSRVSFIDEKQSSSKENQRSGISIRNFPTTSLYSSEQLLNLGFLEKYTSCRWLMAFSCLIMVTCSVLLQQCMSMAVVCIESNYDAGFNFDIGNYSNTNVTINSTTQRGLWNIVWDSEMEGLILQSSFYTYPITPLIGGYLSGRFSGKKVVIVMTLCLVLLSAVLPIAATANPYTVVVLRCCIGLSAGGLQPSMTAIVSKWVPVSERAQIVAVANAGTMIGSILSFSLSGFICMIPIHNGWPFIFYVFCTVNFLSLLLWVCVVYDRPDDHPRITWKERAIINYKRRDSTLEKMPSPPWIKIMTSGPFWGVMIAHMSHAFLFTTIGTFLPLYMSDVLKFEIATNGLLSSLPFIGRFVAAIASGMLADKLMIKEYLSVTATRKIFHASGMVFSTPFLIWMSYMEQSERTTAVILLVTYSTVQSLNNSGFRVNHIDIAPRFAGVLNGMTSSMASAAALLSPIVTSELTKNGTREEWQTVFFICTGVGLTGAMAFVVLGSGVEQEWAKDPNLNVEIDVYTTEEDKSRMLGIIGNVTDNEQDRDVNGSLDNVNEIQKGAVNRALDDQEIKEIIGHVKLCSSFRSQSRNFDVPIKDNNDSCDDKNNVENERDSPEIHKTDRDNQTPTFFQRKTRENLRLNFPESKDLKDDTSCAESEELGVTRL
ncbi:sialin-like [Ostrea edulis]|uniref:sialin-like n=1 Tax=Ostrea edulis TaxID=37623 RepID=UPI0024AF468D|nr:sialin-like [Ostrea edulis]